MKLHRCQKGNCDEIVSERGPHAVCKSWINVIDAVWRVYER